MREVEVAHLESRLSNWRDWFLFYGGGGELAECGSAERRFVTPRVDEEAVAQRNVDLTDVADAEIVHKAMIALPWHPVRIFLHAWYAKTIPVRALKKVVKVDWNGMDSFRRRNLQLLAIEIVRLEMSSVVLIRRGAPIWGGVAIRK